MFILLFFVGLIQFITYWIFEPFIAFLTNVLEIRVLPGMALLIFICLFSANDK